MSLENQGDLEMQDLYRYSATLDGIGYKLITDIKQKDPNTIVIGTSSSGEDELRNIPKPDYVIEKAWG